MLIDYDGTDGWEEIREEMMEIEEVESDVEGDGVERRDHCLRAGWGRNPLDRIGATRHELRQWALTQMTTTDNNILADNNNLVGFDDDDLEEDPIASSVKDDYLM